jgi:hypothetical protein
VTITDYQAEHRERHYSYTKWHATYAYTSADGTYPSNWRRSGIVCVCLTTKQRTKTGQTFDKGLQYFMCTKLTAKNSFRRD